MSNLVRRHHIVYELKPQNCGFSRSFDKLEQNSNTRIMGIREKVERVAEWIFERYTSIVLNHPWKMILITVLCSCIMAFCGIFFGQKTFSMDPAKGFETRNTRLSNERLALVELTDHISSPFEVFNSQFETERRKRRETIDDDMNATNSVIETIDNSTINYDEYGVGYEPTVDDLQDVCVQYAALGDDIPYLSVDATAKVIFEVDSFDTVFTVPMMKKLCQLDEIVNTVYEKYPESQLKIDRLWHSFNLPYYAVCLDAKSEKKCDSLNEENISILKEKILACHLNTTDPNCDFPLFTQLREYIVEGGDTEKRGKFHFAAFLPLNAFAYTENASFFYSELLEELKKEYSSDIKLKGAYFNRKIEVFQTALMGDILLGCISAGLVLICFLIYSGSVLFTGIVLATIVLSLTSAYFMYTIVFNLDFFPFVNLLTLVLMISIGADDAFLLLACYRDMKKMKSPSLEKEVLSNECSLPSLPLLLRHSLSHSLVSMFVTSVTTAIAFMSNITSDVIVIKCFGIFAGLTVSLNYVYVLLLLPPTLCITQMTYSRYSILSRLFASRFNRYRISERLATVIYEARYFGLVILLVSLVVSTFSVFYYPSIRLPDTNPMQYLRSSHPYEWFDDHQSIFSFEANRKIKLVENFVVGVNPAQDSSVLSPSSSGKFSFATDFKMETIEDAMKIKEIVDTMLSTNPSLNVTSWIERFIDLTRADDCPEGCCAKDTHLNETCFLQYARRNFCQQFPESMRYTLADCPIFDKDMKAVGENIKAIPMPIFHVGYFISLPSKYRLTTVYSETQKVFRDLGKIRKDISGVLGKTKYFLLSEPQVTKMYDLLSRLAESTITSTLLSVFVSLIVIIASTRDLVISIASIIVIASVILSTIAIVVWMDWTINVVEATIIVLTIGLSFDYTLHYAVAHRQATDYCMELRILSTNRSVGVAVFNGLITGVLAGTPLLFATTNAFYEIGCFIIIMNLISFISAVFLFPSLLSFFNDLSWWKRRKVAICPLD